MMRVGENPTKFARHNKAMVKLDVKKPKKILAATVVYIPRLDDYYADSLQILDASLKSLRLTLNHDYDLMVVDNGSCQEVVEYLLDCQSKGEIHLLMLLHDNMKKIGAWNLIFGSNQAEYVYFFDCDIFHLDGWYERSKAVLDTFDNVALVNAAPVPMKGKKLFDKTLSSTVSILRQKVDVNLEEGNFTDASWFSELGESLGSDPDKYLQGALSKKQVKCQKNGVEAFVQSWHAQFLAKGEVLRNYFPQAADWAKENNDHGFDQLLNDDGMLRLGITTPLVRHMGNVLSDRNVELINNNIDVVAASNFKSNHSKSFLTNILKVPIIRSLVLKLHGITFNLLYNK